MFPHYKLKEPGWHKWCVEPKTISQRCCRITIRKSWVTDKDWWIDDGTPVYSNTKSNLSSNFKEGTRKQSECEYLCKIIYRSLSSFTYLNFLLLYALGDKMNNKVMNRSPNGKQ